MVMRKAEEHNVEMLVVVGLRALCRAQPPARLAVHEGQGESIVPHYTRGSVYLL